MFKELEIIRQYCIGGLAPLGYEELDSGLYMEGYKRALENVKAYIEGQQERIVQMDRWDFNRFVEEVIHLSEISEVPGIAEARDKLIREMWARFPAECRAMGLTDGA